MKFVEACSRSLRKSQKPHSENGRDAASPDQLHSPAEIDQMIYGRKIVPLLRLKTAAKIPLASTHPDVAHMLQPHLNGCNKSGNCYGSAKPSRIKRSIQCDVMRFDDFRV